MDAHVKTLRDILYSGDQFIVPFFQRHYSWERVHWQRLRDDIVNLMEETDDTKHFLGPLVCTEPFHPVPGDPPSYQLIDGQQRLATITIMLAALRDVAKSRKLDSFAEEIHEDYLIHRRRQGVHRFKVVPRLGDRDAYEKVIENKPSVTTESTGIIGAYSFFTREWKNLVGDGEQAAFRRLLIAATARLSLVVIIVGGENPYEIFESLNSTGLRLDEADLIRNFMFMKVPIDQQEVFEKKHWEPFEERFEASKDKHYEKIPLTMFYRSYVMREGNYCRNKAAYVEFTKRYEARGLEPVAQVEELQKFAKFELWLRRPSTCRDPRLRKACSEIQALDVTTAHPLLIHLLDKHQEGRIETEELLGCFKDIASFVIRRSVCGESTRGYGRIFPEAIKEAIHVHQQKDLCQYWLDKGWPDDAAFISHLVEFPIYKRERNKCRLLLQFLEQRHGHKEEVKLDFLTIEHVMPQSLEKNTGDNSWQKMLGADWEILHEKWVHTLGNLTLTGYNPELGSASFQKKQEFFAKSKVSLNQYFLQVQSWNIQEIRKRGEQLSRILAGYWSRPAGQTYIPPGPTLIEPPDSPGEEVSPVTGGELKIIIRWRLLEKALPDDEICENTAAGTLVKFIERLIRVLGKEMADQLTQVPVVRYPLSRNPSIDFLNPRRGQLYPHALIPGTDLYVCTQSSNKEKEQKLKKLPVSLGLPTESIEVSMTNISSDEP